MVATLRALAGWLTDSLAQLERATKWPLQPPPSWPVESNFRFISRLRVGAKRKSIYLGKRAIGKKCPLAATRGGRGEGERAGALVRVGVCGGPSERASQQRLQLCQKPTGEEEEKEEAGRGHAHPSGLPVGGGGDFNWSCQVGVRSFGCKLQNARLAMIKFGSSSV